jgi:surface protein
MFASAISFNQDIGRWSVGNVIEMRAMFASAESFNQDINKWNIGNVEDMRDIFSGTIKFSKSNIRTHVCHITNIPVANVLIE